MPQTTKKLHSVPERRELLERLHREFRIVQSCALPTTDGGIGLLATHPEERYPYVYPRDVAAAAHFLRGLVHMEGPQSDDAFDLLRGIAVFFCACQHKDGHWGQRYDLEGRDKSIYIQEDGVAHGMIILANYILASMSRGNHIKEEMPTIRAVNKAAAYALDHIYRRDVNLFYSTTAIHESALERGYSLWVNCAFLRAFQLVTQIHSERRGSKISKRILAFKPAFEKMIHRRMNHEGRYIRRLVPDGRVDLRPDITLLSPFYFGFGEVRPDLQRSSVEYMVEHLWDPELGMLQRYPPFSEDIDIHLHAGSGPWMQYTAILSRYWWSVGETDKALTILELIDENRDSDGHIPEHLSTVKRFRDFMTREWQTGLDFRKEFTQDILLPGLPFDLVVEELNNMARTYHALSERCEDPEQVEGGVIPFAKPLMWAHVEYAKAILAQLGIELPR